MCAGYPWLPEPQQKDVAPAAVTDDTICPAPSFPQKHSMAHQPAPESQVTQIFYNTYLLYLTFATLTLTTLTEAEAQ